MKQKNMITLTAGILAGIALGGTAAHAAASLTANPSTQSFYVNGQKAELEAYEINGSNDVKLRDIGKAVGFQVTYDGDTNSVQIDPDAPYMEETAVAAAQPDGSGVFSDTPFTIKVLTGDDGSREDFSQQANPAIFTPVLTRAAYNAARQSILDRDAILAGNNEDGFNPCYAYAYTTATAETQTQMNFVLSHIGTHCRYDVTVEPYLKEYYRYPDYFIVAPQITGKCAEAEDHAENVIKKAKSLSSDAEKVRLLNDYLCSRMGYQRNASASFADIFNEALPPVKGNCVFFAGAFQYLCEMAGVPCVKISSEEHTWNAVYVDGQWLHVDVSINTQCQSRDALLLAEKSRSTDAYPEITAFAMELLVPGSTK